MMETITAPTTADVNPETENPEIKEASNQKIRPFISIEKRPSVRILSGRVRNPIIGRMVAFMNISTAPTISATYTGLTVMLPGNGRYLNTNVAPTTDAERISQCQIIFIYF